MPIHPSEVFRDFKTFNFFNSFEDPLLLQIATLAKLMEYDRGFEFLTQGDVNDCLYFLKSGSVDVIVDKEKVTTLSNSGEVFGEMSVLSGRHVSASVRCANVCQVYVINPKDFSHALPKDRDRFLFLLHKIYSVVIAERLVQTNDKAKQFETANRELAQIKTELEKTNRGLEAAVEDRTRELQLKAEELESSRTKLEQQNAALVASIRKVSDLSEIKDKTLEKIRVLSSDILLPLKKNIASLEIADPERRATLDLALRGLGDFDSFIKPLTDLYQAEKAIRSKRVLFIDEDRKQQVIARMALGGTGVNLDLASSAQEATELLQSKSHDLVICDQNLSETLRAVKENQVKTEIVFLASGEIQTYLDRLKSLPFLQHVVSREVEDRSFTVKNILTTVTKILNADLFGLEKYLAWGVDVHERTIYESSRRKFFIEEMKSTFDQIGVRETLLERCHTVSEEMLMNAIYDAPVTADGRVLFNHLPRTVEVHLKEEQACTYRYACDGNVIGISVADPFGGLLKDTITAYLDSCYRGEAGIYNKTKGGAGRGLHQMIEAADLTIFNVKQKIKTEVICLFYIDKASKKNARKPSFHYFFS